MDRVVELHRKIAPELVALMEERYNVLHHVRDAQPIGRRALAGLLGTSERIVRAQVDFLKAAGLIDFSQMGMSITDKGDGILEELGEYIRALHGFSGLEQELARRLGLKKALIVRGDSEADAAVQRELGRAAAGVLAQYLGDTMTVAVSGGSTMACVAESIRFAAAGTTVVPSRGGLGERVEFQANTIAAVIASRLGGKYRLLHTPESLNEGALEVILAGDPNIREISKLIKKADILITGIGEASAMAQRRGLSPATVAQLLGEGAVGETLGHYCTLTGKVVYTTSSVGLHLDDLDGIGRVIAVAGGRRKAGAIIAVAAAGGQDVLVTDEAAAKAIQEILNNQETREDLS